MRLRKAAVIIIHLPQAQTAEEYAAAEVCPGKTVDPHQQQCPACHAQGGMIRWGSYQREVRIDEDKPPSNSVWQWGELLYARKGELCRRPSTPRQPAVHPHERGELPTGEG